MRHRLWRGIRSAFVEPEFTVRQEPDEIVKALRVAIEQGEEPIKSSVEIRLESRRMNVGRFFGDGLFLYLF
jgi:hypothetical protein